MAGRQARQIRAFAMHGRTPTAVIDYDDFFRWLARLPSNRTEVPVNSELNLAIAATTQRGAGIYFRFVSGDPTDRPLLYSSETGETAEARTPQGTWLASPTRVAVLPGMRVIFIENRRRGVSASNLEKYFDLVAQANDYAASVQLGLSPIPEPSLEQEILELHRIREAALIVNRPNTDWNDASDVISQIADSSGGDRAQVVVNAGRRGSLQKDEGIIPLIIAHLRRRLPNVSELRVVGRKLGEAVDRTLSIRKHQVRASVTVDSRARELDQEEAVFRAFDELTEHVEPLVREDRTQAPLAPSVDLGPSAGSGE